MQFNRLHLKVFLSLIQNNSLGTELKISCYFQQTRNHKLLKFDLFETIIGPLQAGLSCASSLVQL